MSPDAELMRWIADATGARSARRGEHIFTLWSGYGEIVRVALTGADVPSVVLKVVRPPTARRHPRGWTADRGHARKLRSYEVEMTWYRNFSARCDDACRVPRLLAHRAGAEDGWIFVLEDLDAAGFPVRRGDLAVRDTEACLEWLAAFHARFLGESPTGLWPVGTYWHLATRPDELEVIDDPALRDAAPLIDAHLNACRHETFVHGDAKTTNFCFAPRRGPVAAVDFQYVGGGAGIKDVVYFFSSCLGPRECDRHADRLLDVYFTALARHIDGATDFDDLEREWRALYPFAWADFARFLAGWAPGHWRRHRYSQRLIREALRRL